MGRPKKITPTVEKAPLRLPGTFDVLPEQQAAFNFFMERFVNLAQTFGYLRIDTPFVEDAKLFKFWQYSTNDQLLMVNDQKNNSDLAIKPTNLFSLARAYIEHRYFEREKVSKWYYASPTMFVSNNAIKQSDELGFQIFGETAPIADAQIINLVAKLFSEVGLNTLSLEVNNIGCLECLPPYQEVLKSYFKEKKYDLCENCVELVETNPVAILGCTNLSCSTVSAEAPVIVDYLCDNCRKHFIGVLEGLDELGMPYNLNQKVIGKPWSRKTIFEIRYRNEQGEATLGWGGHADDLIQSLGGLPTSALGFVTSMETVLTALNMANLKFSPKNKTEVFLVPLGDLAAKKTLRLFSDLWSNNIAASEFIGPGSIKTQLKLAESSKVAIALIIGQKEAREGTVILRDVRSGMQELFTIERIIEEVKKRLGK
ncbi:MAG TPA: HisS family protein [Verrucomicrobiae bacterium]|nr:HisS family protein [Verrucomicrobiae bacterium]